MNGTQWTAFRQTTPNHFLAELMETPDTIRRFWFGDHASDAAVAADKSSLWWSKNAETDARIRHHFEDMVIKAGQRELDGWAATPDGRLALILLTDQFPRNIYRDSGKAFAFDALARAWCREGLALGVDAMLRPIERVFFYLPLEHSESVSDQAQAVELFQSLAAQAAPDAKATFDGFLDFARRHKIIIDRFGRFPHRNRLLDRASTPEEAAFLAQPGSSF